MLWIFIALALAADPVAVDGDANAVAPAVVEASDAQRTLSQVFAEVERLSGVEARVANGVVHLSGNVPSVGVREEAHDLAVRLPGVLFVDNQIVVLGDDSEHGGGSEDVTIESTLNATFREIGGLDKVSVAVNSGVVRLTGQVVEDAAREKALALAASLDGVVYVDDRIRDSTGVEERLAPALAKSAERLEELVAMLPLLVLGGVVLGISYLLGRLLSSWDPLFQRVEHRPLLRAMLGRLVRSVIVVVGALIALELVGASGLVGAVAGAAGVVGIAFGFALQDIVENYLAGLLLSVQQPFSKDDFIEVAGVKGLVVRLSMRNTLLLTIDGNHTYLPNADVFKGIVINYTRNARRRFAFLVGVGTGDDLGAVTQLGEETLRATAGVLGTPPPRVQIDALGDWTVNLEVSGWVDQSKHDYLAVRTHAIRMVKEAFDAAGVSMPNPSYNVEMMHPLTAPPPRAVVAKTPVDVSVVTDLQDQVDQTRSLEEGEDLLE